MKNRGFKAKRNYLVDHQHTQTDRISDLAIHILVDHNKHTHLVDHII
jgi:hypothetical protein